MPDVSIHDQLECARRELKLRRRVYGRRVEAGQMTQALSDKEIRAMEAIVETIEGLASKERLI